MTRMIYKMKFIHIQKKTEELYFNDFFENDPIPTK